MKTAELSSLIQYRCIQPGHLAADALDRVFVHEDGWAYCPAGRLAATDHQFSLTGGLERRRLEGGMTMRSPAKPG